MDYSSTHGLYWAMIVLCIPPNLKNSLLSAHLSFVSCLSPCHCTPNGHPVYRVSNNVSQCLCCAVNPSLHYLAMVNLRTGHQLSTVSLAIYGYGFIYFSTHKCIPLQWYNNNIVFILSISEWRWLFEVRTGLTGAARQLVLCCKDERINPRKEGYRRIVL